MSTPAQPPNTTQGTFNVGSVVSKSRPDDIAANVTHDEFLTLCEGDTGSVKSGLYFSIGLLVSAVIGILSLFENLDWQKFWSQQRFMPLVYFSVLLFLGASAIVGCAVCGWLTRTRKRGAFYRTESKFRAYFEAQKSAATPPQE